MGQGSRAPSLSLSLRAATSSSITTDCHTVPSLWWHRTASCVSCPLPAHAWGEAGGQLGEGGSCSFREDLYSLLIDVLLTAPQWLHSLHSSFSALPWAWGWVFKAAQWPKSVCADPAKHRQPLHCAPQSAGRALGTPRGTGRARAVPLSIIHRAAGEMPACLATAENLAAIFSHSLPRSG